MRQPFLAAISCHATKKLGNLNALCNKMKNSVELKQKSKVKVLWDVLSDAAKTSEGKVVF